MQGDSSPDSSGDDKGEWLSIRQAAHRLGISRVSVYGRIKRGTLKTRPVGNKGQQVWLSHDMQPNSHDATAEPELVDELRDRVAQLEQERERLVGEVERWRSEAEQARIVGERLKTVEELLSRQLDREIARADRLEAELLRRPWWAKLLGR